MPELPEVQTTVDGLNEKTRGRKIVGVWCDWAKLKDVEKTKGFKIERVARRGKNVLFYLTKSRASTGSATKLFSERAKRVEELHVFLVHMKMTGHLLVGQWEITGKKVAAIKPEALKERDNSYVHFILTLDDGKMIGFSDLRKFGKVIFGPTEKIENLPELKKLGPEAVKTKNVIASASEAISLNDFIKRISAKKKTIYQTLMDQTTVAGIGNIYASEILWKAKVYPLKAANKLSGAELKAIHKAAKEILTKALKLGGTSTADYRNAFGEKGGYGKVRMAYQRENEPCLRCGTKMKRIKKAGRSAHYCPSCQKI